MKRVFVGLFIFAFCVCNSVFAADYRVLVVPDNLANKSCMDAFIYEESAEFFANQIINTLNKSGTIEAITVSEARDKLSKNPRLNIATRESLVRFKKEYNINYMNLKKLSQMFGTNKILLLTTSADAQNYFTRRTFWDFLNVPGASVIDPAIKLSTYAVLVDTDKCVNEWENTFYKTISACESRMVANSLEPQTQQLEKIRDYSRLLAPQVATNVQAAIVPASELTRNNKIDYSMKDLDNVFLKKVRSYKRATKKWAGDTDYKIQKYKEKRAQIRAEKEEQKRLEQEQFEQQQQEQQLNNVNEVRTETVEIKEAVDKKEKTIENKVNVNKVEPKQINISKDDYVEKSPKIDIEEKVIEPPQLRYYQPRGRIINIEKNKTINDI